jgi:flavin-binding protein dodecin
LSGVYKKIEIVGTSPVSFAEATRSAVEEAARTVRNMSWFEVTEQRGAIRDGKVAEFQVTLKVGFKVEG